MLAWSSCHLISIECLRHSQVMTLFPYDTNTGLFRLDSDKLQAFVTLILSCIC